MPKPRRFMASAYIAIATMMSLSTVRAQNPPAAGGVFVDLQSSDQSVRIEQVMGNGVTSPVCHLPCRKVLTRDALYVIRGDGMPATSSFVLPSDRSDLTLTVRPGSRAGRIAGMTLMLVGVAAIAVGYALSPADAAVVKDSPPPPAHPWGLLVGLGGIGAAGLGFGLWWGNETRVSSSSGRTFAETPRAAHKRPALALTARGLEF